jgi:hypothetical protein
MTMPDQETPATSKPKRKYTRRAKPAARPVEFAGLTATDCCDGCTETRCVISGSNVCSHPHKGGLQASQMIQHEVVKRYNRAKKILGTPHA